MSHLLNQLRLDLEASGLKPGTEEFEKEFRAQKVILCKEQRAVDSCWDCPFFDHCELIKAHLRDLYQINSIDAAPPVKEEQK